MTPAQASDVGARDAPAVDVVVFDLDGTLVDSAPGIFASLRRAFDEVGHPRLAADAEARLLGPPLHRALLPHIGREATAAVVPVYRRIYADGGLDATTLFPGVRTMLDTLSGAGITLAVGTSKPEPFAVRICENLDLVRYFRTVCGDTLDGGRDTKTAVLRETGRRLGGVRSAVMIGDRSHDVHAAVELGWTPVGVLWGYGPPEELSGARHVVRHPDQVAPLLLR